MSTPEHKFLVDLYFYKCTRQVNYSFTKNIAFFVIQSIVLIFIMFLNSLMLDDIQQTELITFSQFINVSIISSTAQLVCAIYFYSQLRKSQKILTIATKLKHAILLQDINSSNKSAIAFQKDRTTGLLVSTTFYDFQSMEQAKDVSQQSRIFRQTSGNKNIRTVIQNSSSWNRFLTCSLNIKSIGIVTVGFIISCIIPMSEIQFTIIRIFLLAEVIFRVRLYSALVLIMLAPFALIAGCVYYCFIKLVDKKIKLPNPESITQQEISNCSECSICFQSYTINQNIIALPCSKMHRFHSQCIRGWTKIKSNCPICRKNII